MSLHSWLQNLGSALAPGRAQRQHARRGSKRAPTHRPNLEVLEDRSVPAFLAPVDYAAYPYSFDIAMKAGDFNGDAILDLATVGQGGGVAVLLGNPDGTFQPARYSEAGTSAAEPSLAVGDFNEDGKLDLATNSNYDADYQYGFDDVAVLLGNGDGTFVPIYLGTNLAARAVATGDLNGDGHADLVVVSWDDDSLSALLGGGDGTFAPPTTYDGSYSDYFPSLALADFNGDGNLDQAYLGAADLAVSLGHGDGSFDGPIRTPVGPYPYSLVVADFNADGRPDAAVTVSPDQVRVLLNDGVWPPSPSLGINDVTVTEGNVGTVSASFTVTLSAASTQPVTVAYATGNGTATAGSDYQAASGTLAFAPGETSKTVTVRVNGDRLGEPNETFFVNLSGATNAAIADGQGTGTIVDDEPRISISDVTKSEGKKGGTTQFTFTVTLSAAYDQPVTVSFKTTNGTATTSDKDYVAQTGTLTFAPGQTTKTITILVNGDARREANEYFSLDLFGNSRNSLFTKSRGTGTILNDD